METLALSRRFTHWPFSRLFRIVVTGLALGCLGAAQAQVNLVQDPSFENGVGTALSGSWNVVQTNGGVEARTAGSALGSGVAPALLVGNGVKEAVLLTPGPSTNILYQDVILPAVGPITVQVTVGLVVFNPSANLTDFYRVDIVQAIPATLALGAIATNSQAFFNANVLQAIYAHDRSADVPSTETAIFDISALAGQTVRFRAVNNAQNNYTQGVLDNVRIMVGGAAIPVPTLSGWAMILMALLMAISGFLILRNRRF